MTWSILVSVTWFTRKCVILPVIFCLLPNYYGFCLVQVVGLIMYSYLPNSVAEITPKMNNKLIAYWMAVCCTLGDRCYIMCVPSSLCTMLKQCHVHCASRPATHTFVDTLIPFLVLIQFIAAVHNKLFDLIISSQSLFGCTIATDSPQKAIRH